MSLVNDMLRDLDERKREGSSGYHAVAKRDSHAGRWMWVAVFIVLVAIIIFFVAREWGGKINDRVHLLSWLDTEQTQPTSTGQPSAQQSLAVTAQQLEVQKESPAAASSPTQLPEQTPVVLTNISVINWTTQTEHQGTLTFWLDQVKPFLLYSRTSTTLDIAIDESRLVAGLPDMRASLLTAIDIVPEEGKSRFKLVADGPVEFTPQLKQNPARLVVNVTRPVAIVAAESSTAPREKKETISVLKAEKESLLEREPKAGLSKNPEAAVQATTQITEPKAGQWKKSLNTLPTDSSVVRNARRLLGQQRTDEALDLLKDYVNKTPASLQSRYLLVQLYLATERYTAASDLLHNAPDNLSWGLLKARTLLQQGEATQAIQLLDQYPNGQNRQDYLDLLASGYQQAGQHAAAVARYLSLLALNSQEGRWWINLGVSLEHLGQREKALDAYRSALQIPDLDQSLKQYAQLQSQRLMQSQ